MRIQGSAGSDGIVIAEGFGLKVYVDRGHLVVHDGIGPQRQTRRFSRATSGLTRLIVVGHTGFVTLDALRWIRDIGAAMVQIDRDGEVVAATSAERFNNTRLRRAQVVNGAGPAGLEAIRELVLAKVDHQLATVERLSPALPEEPLFGYRPHDPIPTVIARQRESIGHASDRDELRAFEAVAGRWYWHVLAHTEVHFDGAWRSSVPDHWHRAGPRTSPPSGYKSSRKAATPFHALVNYAYAILETEAVIVLQAVGFDPGVGIMHTDKRYRGSLATDLMEPGRPIADELVLDLLATRTLKRRDVFETREGVCRVGPTMAKELAQHGPALRKALEPHAAQLAKSLIGDTGRVASPARARRLATASGKGQRRRVAPRA